MQDYEYIIAQADVVHNEEGTEPLVKRLWEIQNDIDERDRAFTNVEEYWITFKSNGGLVEPTTVALDKLVSDIQYVPSPLFPLPPLLLATRHNKQYEAITDV